MNTAARLQNAAPAGRLVDTFAANLAPHRAETLSRSPVVQELRSA